ncbi:alpha/beta-hydrolase [Lactarius hatsudake]|nr:alpha/beta-hydrolase [Lactarius hatsudake]
MRCLVFVLLAWNLGALTLATPLQSPLLSPPIHGGISEHVYSELSHFAKYSSAVYQFICPRPLGNTLVESFANLLTHAHGLVARDEARREIVIAFRGSHEPADVLTDGNLVLAPLVSRGVEDNTACVHAGFLFSYNSVRSIVLRAVREQLEAFPGYAVVLAGHSLGGALASLAALSVKSNFPWVAVRLFTFGQPRTGDAAFADLLEAIVGRDNIFRGKGPFRYPAGPETQSLAHLLDGVPTVIPEYLGYRHHANEYWQFQEPPNMSTVRLCEGQEDPECSHSIPSLGINPAHGVYFGQAVMTMDVNLCL